MKRDAKHRRRRNGEDECEDSPSAGKCSAVSGPASVDGTMTQRGRGPEAKIRPFPW